MKQKDSGDKPIFGMLSGRELFYFLFALFVIIALVFYGWAFNWFGGGSARENPKYVNGRLAATAMASDRGTAGGYAISKSQVLYYDAHNYRNAPWRIYDSERDEITDGSRLVPSQAKSQSVLEALTNGARLVGWKGTVILTTQFSTNQGQLLFQWSTNNDELQICKCADYSGGSKSVRAFNVVAVQDAWLYSQSFFGYKGPLAVAGNRAGPATFTKPFATNLKFASAWPFQQGLYVVATTTNQKSTAVYVLSLTNHTLILSNLSVKIPVTSEWLAARPDPSGNHVVWIFGYTSKMDQLRGVLASIVRHGSRPEITVSYYSSDMSATRLHFIASVASPNLFFWGANGDSIWLPDPEKGIKQYQLK